MLKWSNNLRKKSNFRIFNIKKIVERKIYFEFISEKTFYLCICLFCTYAISYLRYYRLDIKTMNLSGRQ